MLRRQNGLDELDLSYVIAQNHVFESLQNHASHSQYPIRFVTLGVDDLYTDRATRRVSDEVLKFVYHM